MQYYGKAVPPVIVSAPRFSRLEIHMNGENDKMKIQNFNATFNDQVCDNELCALLPFI